MGATELWLVRHGESVANVAAAEAEAAGLDRLEVVFRDADVPLSARGEHQAEALGGWLAANLGSGASAGGDGQAEAEASAVGGATPALGAVWVSPYLRARQTAEVALESAGLPTDLRIDERLRDRELGILDLLTSQGVDRLMPDEAARRRWLGKFYYRPPGGESWSDVALRVRSVLCDLDAGAGAGADADAGADARGPAGTEAGVVPLARPKSPTLVVAHDAVVMLFVYVCTGLTEAELLDFARTHTVSNASVTKLVRPSGQGRWMLDLFSHDDHIEASGVAVTQHSGDKDALIH